MEEYFVRGASGGLIKPLLFEDAAKKKYSKEIIYELVPVKLEKGKEA